MVNEELSGALSFFTGEINKAVEGATSEVKETGSEVSAKVHELQSVLKGHTQLSVLCSEQTAVLSNGRVICVTCTGNMSALRDGRSLRSKFIAINGGVAQDSMLSSRWSEHEGSDGHAISVEAEKLQKQSPMARALSEFEVRQNLVATTLFRTCAFGNIHKQSFYMFEENLAFLHGLGVDIGAIEHSRKSAREMTLALADGARRQVKQYITTVNPMTGALPLVGVAADKLTDLGKVQSQIIMIRVNYAGTPLTLYGKLTPLGLEYDPDHEASGLACFNQLCEVRFYLCICFRLTYPQLRNRNSRRWELLCSRS